MEPMLAHNYTDRGNDIEFPCFLQPKLDGVRALYHNNKFWSRNGNEFVHLQVLKDELSNLSNDIILDGELYSYSMSFQKLVGLVKKKYLTKSDEQDMDNLLVYVVYDIVSDDDYKDRLKTLTKLFKNKFNKVELLKTEICHSPDDIPLFLAKYEKEGFEGLIVRNKIGSYIGGRSVNLQKLKSFVDSEFEIIDYTEGTGKDKGCVIWICKTPNNKEFKVRPSLPNEERKWYFDHGPEFVGKLLTVKYQSLSTNGIPRFPVGLTIRDYE
jgi:ATP-dependent DNA ligase